MQNITNEYKQTIDAPVRKVDAKVELFNGSTLVDTFTKNDAIKSIDIERVGENSKFFGFGVSHKFNIKLIDKDRLLNISTANHFKINLGAILSSEAIEYIPFTSAHVTEVNRDENTNELSITAYCKLNYSKSITINELALETPYTIKDVAEAIGTKLGATTTIIDETITAFNTEYTDGANFEGTETLIEVLKAIAEATQTIYTMNGEDALVFKRLDQNGEAVKTIDKEKYFTLDSKTNRRLATICHATELGDNVSASKMEKSNKTMAVDLGDNELCAIGDVKDELVVENRKAKIIKRIGKVVLNGSENIGIALTGTPNFYYHTMLNDNYKQKNQFPISNYFIGTSIYSSDTNVGICLISNGQLRIRTANEVSVNDFKAWLSTHNTTVYYRLETPEEIDFDISGLDLADGVYYGESTQATRSGYNILPNNGTSTTINGITFTVNEDKSITLNGTATDNANFPIFGTGWNITDEQITLATGTYFTIGTGTNNAIVYCRDGINNINAATQLNNVQVTNQLALITYVYIQVPSGKTVSNETIYPMIVKGEYTKNTFPKYEQYGASPSRDFPSEIVNKETVDANILYPITGTTQYVRDNPFWDLREDIGEIVENAIYSIGGLTINQFECEWRGDFSLEPCDKIALTTKDNDTVVSYILNDSLHYSGALEESTEWQYTDSEETESNPSNLGEALKQTHAKVDKANKQITLLASETTTNSSAISSLQIETNRINASVQSIEKTTNEAIDGVNNDIETLTKTVDAKMSAEDVTLEIKKEIANGISKVETTTGFKFDENGLTVSKTGSEMTTTIDENGMTIKRDDEEQLVADNEGVKAYDLHAKTYLIVGENSRFEDYEKDGEARTGCFWIGGNG